MPTRKTRTLQNFASTFSYEVSVGRIHIGDDSSHLFSISAALTTAFPEAVTFCQSLQRSRVHVVIFPHHHHQWYHLSRLVRHQKPLIEPRTLTERESVFCFSFEGYDLITGLSL